jgi:hypothetical protein
VKVQECVCHKQCQCCACSVKEGGIRVIFNVVFEGWRQRAVAAQGV